MATKFDLDQFVICPTFEQFERCRKDDLLTLADFFRISVPRSANKRDIKELLCAELIKQRILVEPTEEGVAFDLVGSEDLPAAEAGRKSEDPTRIDPAVAAGSPLEEPALTLQLKQLDLELSRQQYQSQLIQLQTLELEAKKEIKLKELELRFALGERPEYGPNVPPAPASPAPAQPVPLHESSPVLQRAHQGTPSVSVAGFDVSRHIALVPMFRESEVDTYFSVFERIAATLQWPRNIWTLLLQCKFVGKAQEVCSALSLEQSMDYETVKSSVLRAYELVPEAYRQRFRKLAKTASQTYVEFAREKSALFDKWCAANKVVTLEQLKELILLEEFKSCLSDKMVVYLNEQKVSSLADAAVLADEFVLTHRTVFSSRRRDVSERVSVNTPKNASELRECFYCRESGHLIAACPVLTRKNRRKAHSSPKSVALAHTPPQHSDSLLSLDSVDSTFEPFIIDGMVSLSDTGLDFKSVRILRDTGAAQSFILEGVLPLSDQSSCGTDVLVQGIELGVVKAPLHNIYLRSDVVAGFVKVAVRSQLPVKGVSFILGNDLAGGKVFCWPVVTDNPTVNDRDELPREFPSVFTSCVVTRAQARKMKDADDLSDSFMCSTNPLCESTPESDMIHSSETDPDSKVISVLKEECDKLGVGRSQLVEAQQSDPSLSPCVAAVVEKSNLANYSTAYFFDGYVLMRKWAPPNSDHDWRSVFQVVVPKPYRTQVLSVAHDHDLSGHLGVRKTYNRVLKHFFWPAMMSDVSSYCNSCRVCQVAGKPNQVIPPCTSSAYTCNG